MSPQTFIRSALICVDFTEARPTTPPADASEVLRRREIAKGKRNAALPEDDDDDTSRTKALNIVPFRNDVGGPTVVTGRPTDSTKSVEMKQGKRKVPVEDKDGQRKRLKVISDNWKTCRKILNVLPLGCRFTFEVSDIRRYAHLRRARGVSCSGRPSSKIHEAVAEVSGVRGFRIGHGNGGELQTAELGCS